MFASMGSGRRMGKGGKKGRSNLDRDINLLFSAMGEAPRKKKKEKKEKEEEDWETESESEDSWEDEGTHRVYL